MRLKKIIITVLSIVLILIVAAFLYLQSRFKSSIPERSGTVMVGSLNAPVQVTFDKMGVPQIWARTTEDALFALGWVHAGDRLFQMDMLRRISQGRLAEFFGAEVLDIDRMQRKIGHKYLAERALGALEEQERKYLSAYTSGINAYVQQKKVLPPEYFILNVGFEPWTMLDCIALFSFQTWFSDALQNNDDLLNQAADLAGIARVKQLLAGNPIWMPTTVPVKERDWISELNSRLNSAHFMFNNGIDPYVMTSASNCWVVAPHRSESGRAIMASDPHLDVSRLPQFWYIAGIHSFEENLDVLGITTPGIPVVVFGHNGNVSWAFTAAGTDLIDYYTEFVNPENENQYKGPDGWQPFEERIESIKIRGTDQAEELRVKLSRHGPVITANDTLNHAYAYHWAGFDVSLAAAVKNGFRLPHVSDFQTFREIVTGLAALNANWMYADRLGNIGYQLGAPIPVRQSTQNTFRLAGWTSMNDWLGYQTLENTPHVSNPERGWLATCNNLPSKELPGYSLTGNFAGDRILRIEKLLETEDKYTVEDMQRFQLDLYSEFMLRWKFPLSDLLKQLKEEEWSNQIMDWQGSFHAESRAGALIEKWLYYMRENMFRDELGDLTDQIHIRVLFRDRVLFELYSQKNNIWFDDILTLDKVETRDDIALKSMRQAIHDVGEKEWSDLQYLTMSHPMGEVPVISTLLGLKKGPFIREGNPGTLNVSTANPTEDGMFQTIGGASWRFVIDFAEIDKAVMVIPAGQSGHPLDEHFFDFHDLWSSGKYWTVPFTRPAVDKKMVSMLELIPNNLP